MAHVVPWTFAGKVVLDAGELDSAFKVFTDVLTNGLDETNLAASAKFAPSQLANKHSLDMLSVTGVHQTTLGPCLVRQEARVVGATLYRNKTTADPARVSLILEVLNAAGHGQQEMTWELDDSKEDPEAQVGTFHLNPTEQSVIPSGAYVKMTLWVWSGSVDFLSGQVFLAREHVNR